MSTGTPQAGDSGHGPPEHPQPTAPTARRCRGHPHCLPSPQGVQKGFGVSVLCWSLCATDCPHPTAAPESLSQHQSRPSATTPQPCFSRSRGGFWAAWTRHKVDDSLGLSYSGTSSRAPDQDSGDRDRAGPRGCLAHSSPSPATPAPQGMQNFPPSEDHRKSPKSPFCLPRAHSQHPMTAGMHPATARSQE